MLRFAAILLLGLSACPAAYTPNAQPLNRLYYPTGLVHVDSAASDDGVLFVANANYDKRYEAGSVMALDLGKVGLPAFGAPVSASGPVQVQRLHAALEGVAQVSSFTGELAALQLGPNRYRLFVPSRSEGMKFQAIDATLAPGSAQSTSLVCHTPSGRNERECATNGLSLSPREVEDSATGLPRAPGPYGVAVRVRACSTDRECRDGDHCVQGACAVPVPGLADEPFADVYVTHLSQADSPNLSQQNYQAFLVRLDSSKPAVSDDSYFPIGSGGSNTPVAGKRFVYLTGRYFNPSSNLLRLVDRTGVVLSTGLESSYRVAEGRGAALAADESRIYVAGRSPDALIVASLTNQTTNTPLVQVQRVVSLPDGANEVATIPRAGRTDLVAVTCIGAGALALYDDEVGDVVALISGIGAQPFGIAVDRRGDGARLYVSNFSDGRIAVIDVPDLVRPQSARLVAHLGPSQTCLTQTARGTAIACDVLEDAP